MENSDRKRTIGRLRDCIAGLEKRAVLAKSLGSSHESAAPVLRTPAGILNEVWANEKREAGAALGFALGQARGLLTSSRLAVLWLQLARDAQDTGLPYGAGLSSFGFDPDQLVIGRMQRIEDLLWATEEAIACQAVAGIVADIGRPAKVLDFTVSRRLSLRAHAAGTSVFMLRYGREREASAAGYRWRVSPVLSQEVPFDARAPGGPRWHVCLEKGQQQKSECGGRKDWILNWTENGFEICDDKGTGTRKIAGTAPLHGAQPATLGHGLPKTA